MEKDLDAQLRGWRILRLFFVGWVSLTLISIGAMWPRGLQGLILVVSVLGMLLAATASGGNKVLGVLSLSVIGVAFFGLLILQIASKSVPQNAAATVLQFVMLLLAVEVFSVIARLASHFSSGRFEEDGDYLVSNLQRSLQQALRRLSRAGVILGTGYVASVGALYLGTSASIPALLGDVSLYVVVASISLALLLVLREEESTRETVRSELPEDRRL